MQQSGVLVEVPFLQLGILLHVSQCMHFFFSSSKARGSSQTCSDHQYHYRGGSNRMVTRVSLLSALHGLVSVEELWRQKLCLAIISDFFEERDNGDVISRDRRGFMQRRMASCSSAGITQCGSALQMTVPNIPSQSLS